MKLVKRILCGALAVTMAFGLCSCGKKEDGASSGGITKVKLLLTGEKPAIFDEIYGEVNRMLREDVQAELEVVYMNSSDISNKYSLLFTDANSCDMVFSANWIDYVKYAQKNCFMEITEDMIKEYMPQTYASIPKDNLDDARVNGKIYMIPGTTNDTNGVMLTIRGDLRKKYNLDPPKNFDDFYKYLKTVAENEPELIAYTTPSDTNVWHSLGANFANSNGYDNIGIKFDMNADKFVVACATEEYMKWAKLRRQMVEDGIIPSDIYANKTVSSMFEQGRTPVYTGSFENTVKKYNKSNTEHPEWELEVYDINEGRKIAVNNATGSGISINAKSKKAEKALQILDLLRNDPRYYYLTQYGIEGKHWTKVGEDGYDPSINEKLPEAERYEPGCVWGWINSKVALNNVTVPPMIADIAEKQKEQTIVHPLSGFNFVDDDYKVKITTVTGLGGQYSSSIGNGMLPIDQIEAANNEQIEALRQAGLFDVCDAMNEQYQEFKKNKQ